MSNHIPFATDACLLQELKMCYTVVMKLIAPVKLNPTKEQAKLLKRTLEQANAACDAISELAFGSQTFGQYAIHKAYYSQIREQLGLSAQIVVRCIAKVADAYKLDKEVQRKFKPLGAIAFDDRILTWRTAFQFVNIWTVEGRQKIPYLCGEKQARLLETRMGETDLVYRKGTFYLLAVCEVPEPTPQEIDDALGIDMGTVQLATDNDGQHFDGADVDASRLHYLNKKRQLQRKASQRSKAGKRPKNIRRKLKDMSGCERRFKLNTNHVISRRIVDKAKDTNRGIAIEDLKGITSRIRFRKSQRDSISKWAFSELRGFIQYKALLAGVTVVAVDPAYTSQRCSECGHTERGNRRTRGVFWCKKCGYFEHADINAAKNISKAAVSQLDVSEMSASPDAFKVQEQAASL